MEDQISEIVSPIIDQLWSVWREKYKSVPPGEWSLRIVQVFEEAIKPAAVNKADGHTFTQPLSCHTIDMHCSDSVKHAIAKTNNSAFKVLVDMGTKERKRWDVKFKQEMVTSSVAHGLNVQSM